MRIATTNRQRRRFLGSGSWFRVLVPVVFLGALAPAKTAFPEILLNEVMADPARDWDGDALYNFRDDEWVEIVNTGPGAVSLEGYRLAGADTSWRYAFSGTLGAGERAVVYGSQSYLWEEANGEPQYGLRLGNTGGEIVLWHLTSADSAVVDGYAYVDHEAEDDRSSGRLPDGTGTWSLFDALNPYSGSEEPGPTGCEPSPGEAVICTVPVERGTWGRLKMIYTGGE
jgi:hypothetical protein